MPTPNSDHHTLKSRIKVDSAGVRLASYLYTRDAKINMALVHSLHGLRSDPQISQLIVSGKSTGKHLGTGSYGSVEEVLNYIIYIIHNFIG